MKRRNLIQLSAEEQQDFLRRTKTLILSTIDHRGYPHSVPMWYEMDGATFVMTTYAKSQKAMNIRRDPKVALLAEAGETYDTLKGVLIRGRAEIISDVDMCVGTLLRVHEKMAGAPLPPGADEALRVQAGKRVIIKVAPERVSSWDHSKLGGTY
jgi:PPOX class probable F420-dependent enzyme